METDFLLEIAFAVMVFCGILYFEKAQLCNVSSCFAGSRKISCGCYLPL
jgi:hypothetical protein